MNQVQMLVSRLPEVVKSDLALIGASLSSLIKVEKLSHGLSNQNYLLVSKEHQWVLRINSTASSQICDRNSEVKNWQIAASQGLAPALRYVSCDKKYYLSDFVVQGVGDDWGRLMGANSAHPLIDEHVHWHNAEQALILLLKQLSELECPDNHLSVSEQWQIYHNSLECFDSKTLGELAGQKWQLSYAKLLSIQDDISRWLVQLESCALGEQYSHRDLNPHNLLLSQGALKCIDFEYACSSHPLFDLAGVLSSHVLSTTQRCNIIDSYLENHPKLTSDGKMALPAAINIYWVFASCWALLMAAESDEETYVDDIELQGSPQQGSQYLQCFNQFIALIVR